MNTNAKLALTALMILTGVGVAQAQGHRGGEGMTFETLDVDGSGEITIADIDALRTQRFAEADTNGDGSISEAEFVAKAQADAGERAALMFARLDADGDGTLSRDALEGRVGRGISDRMISRADSDGSGGVSAEEFDAALERFAEHRGKGGKGRFNR